MAEEQPDFVVPLLNEFNTKLQDIEEKQRLIKERVMLLGENLVEMKTETEIASIRTTLDIMKNEVIKIRDTIGIITDEISDFARREEVDILRRQAAMFEPLKLARIEDVKKMIKNHRSN